MSENAAAIEFALKRMFSPTGTFYVSDMDRICRLANVIYPPGVRDMPSGKPLEEMTW